MHEGTQIYHIMVVLTAAAGLVIGWRKGFLRQIGGLCGIILGMILCRVLHDPGIEAVRSLWPSVEGKFASDFIYSTLASALIFGGTYAACWLAAGLLGSMMKTIRVGALNSIAGAAFCAFKFLTVLSLFFNLVLCVKPEGSLMKSCKAGDGNMIETVTGIAPALFDSYNADDLALRKQLQDAKKISLNIYTTPYVIEEAAACGAPHVLIDQKLPLC